MLITPMLGPPDSGIRLTKTWCDYKSSNYVNLIDWSNIVPVEVVPVQVLVIRDVSSQYLRN